MKLSAVFMNNSGKKKGKIFISLLTIISLCLPCYSQVKKEKEKEVSVEKKFNSLQKSLLIPGWGQIAERKYPEGFLFLTAEIFCLYKVFSYNNKGNKYYDLYKKADDVSNTIQYRELTEKYDTRRNKFILAVAGIWVINLIDMYLIIRNKEKKQKKLKLEIKQNENKELVFTLSFSF